MNKILKKTVLLVIKIYQKTLSPNHGLLKNLFPYAGCRYYPSCSVYLSQAIEKKGLILGIFLGLKRLLKCHPFAQGGYDPSPK